MNITDKIDLLLKEAHATNKVETPISDEEALKILETKCAKNAKEDRIIFRGNKVLNNNYYLFTGKETRASAYTANYTTMLFSDYLSSWSAYPKRNKALVCTTSFGKAFKYGNLFQVVPFDSTTKFGVAGVPDFWDIIWKNPYFRKIHLQTLTQVNFDLFSALGRENVFIEMAKKPMREILKSRSDVHSETFKMDYAFLAFWYAGKNPDEAFELARDYGFKQASNIPKNLLDMNLLTILNKIMAPDQTTVKLINSYAALKSHPENEVWLDQPAIMIKIDPKDLI